MRKDGVFRVGLSYLFLTTALFLVLGSIASASDAFRWNLGDSTLILSEDGKSQLLRADGSPVSAPVDAFRLKTISGVTLKPTRVLIKEPSEKGDVFDVVFDDGSLATYCVRPDLGFVTIDLLSLTSAEVVDECVVFMLTVPSDDGISGWINTTTLSDGFRVGLMTTSINVAPHHSRSGGFKGDQKGCDHSFVQLPRSKANDELNKDDATPVAEFSAKSSRKTGDGWNVHGRNFDKPLDLSGCLRLRARIWGDGKGEQLKIQLGGKSGHRDDYINVNFTGWKVCELNSPDLNDLTYDSVQNLYFYYNGLPPETSVRCLIDWVDVILDVDGVERSIRLEDFVSETLPYWESERTALAARSFSRHGVFPASCAVVATSSENWANVVERLQMKAGVPSPKPGNGWRGASPYIHQSYFFLTNFQADEYEKALSIAKRGGFKQILLLQNSWCQSTGTYAVNERSFPGGLPKLREIIDNFNREGIRFGLHLLAASVDSDDPYLTPVPDPRFVTDVSSKLAENLEGTAESQTIKTTGDGTVFPTGENPYMGSGQVVRIDDELIEYGRAEKDGLYDCRRGLYGTAISSHNKGARVVHFTRAYGYHLPDLDTDFIDEIAANFAKVANELPIEMVYFDGSEKLQRPSEGSEHWYYNARLHKAFYDALENKNILFQASSCSPYSWHMISRNASADGHDDLKAYLEERSGGFSAKHPESSYLDVGWYYAYDKNATPDMYEYCLGATLAYDASFSFQTSVSSALTHPFIGEILDMIREFEDLRLSGRVSEELCSQFELDKRLAGRKSVDERNALLNLRKEFHLERVDDGTQRFRRVVYPVWQNAYAGRSDLGGTTSSDAHEDNGAYVWELQVDVPCRVGLQVHFKSEGDAPEETTLVNPRVTFTKIGEKDSIGDISIECEIRRGQFVFALPDQKETIYGLPLNEPQTLNDKTPDIRIDPGVYRVSFEIERGKEVPVRVRTPLYTDEIYPISN